MRRVFRKIFSIINRVLFNSSYTIKKIDLENQVPIEGLFYQENDEVGAKNLEDKMARVESGGPFEWPNILALNEAVATLLGSAKKVVNIGSGTGYLEWFASVDRSKTFYASEFDLDCREWSKANRSAPNIHFGSQSMEELIRENGPFDLAISIEVIEHIKDYSEFLIQFSKLAPKAIITTPNKDRTVKDAMATSPIYYQHVREWTASEFYWVLRCYYKEVKLYAMKDEYVPSIYPVGFGTKMTPLIAVCEEPIDWNKNSSQER